jgi:hypothetical protein
VEALKFGTSLILVSLLCDLNNYVIIGSALPVRRFLIINLIEQGYLLIIGYPMIFSIFHSMVTMRLGVVVVVVSYATPELHSRLGVTFNAIYEMHQPNINLKT